MLIINNIFKSLLLYKETLMAVLIFIGIIVCFIICQFNLPKLKGKIGENSVALTLSILQKDKYTTFNDIIIKNGDTTSQIDHIVVSPYGIFVIETKNYKGWIYGNTNSDYWTQNIWGNKYKLYNPIFQNNTHIKALKNALNKFGELKFIPAIVFVNTQNIKLYGNEDYILWRSELLSYIKRFYQPIIDDNTRLEIITTIRNLNITDRKERKRHIQNVRNIIIDKTIKQSFGRCPLCGGIIIEKKGKYGIFKGCKNYPNCNYTTNH